MSLRVVNPGLHTLVVDAGRPGWRCLGVPVGGAADRFSLAVGNGLVSNPANAAALEITLAGPTLEAECDLACVVYGAPFELKADGRRVVSGRTFTLHAGETLHVGGTPTRLRAYLCIRGGIGTAPILDSRSAFQPLRAGDALPVKPGEIGTRWIDEDRGTADSRQQVADSGQQAAGRRQLTCQSFFGFSTDRRRTGSARTICPAVRLPSLRPATGWVCA